MASKDNSGTEGRGAQIEELVSGTHVELINAKFSGGVKMNNGDVILLGVVCKATDFHGDLAALETLGSRDFRATVVIDGRIVREVVPDAKVPDGQQELPMADGPEDDGGE